MVIIADTTLTAQLEKLAQIKHPVTGTRRFVKVPVFFTFTTVDGVETLTLTEDGTHRWPFADEPSLVFDDRSFV
jgi:hypothetical protein